MNLKEQGGIYRRVSREERKGGNDIISKTKRNNEKANPEEQRQFGEVFNVYFLINTHSPQSTLSKVAYMVLSFLQST